MTDRQLIARLLGYARPYWKDFIIVFVVMVISIVYDLVAPVLLGDVVDMVKTVRETTNLSINMDLIAGLPGDNLESF